MSPSDIAFVIVVVLCVLLVVAGVAIALWLSWPLGLGVFAGLVVFGYLLSVGESNTWTPWR